MPVEHKFREVQFNPNFSTSNAIMNHIPYDPKVLFLGTFNPLTNEAANMADFFYGRNWFWPCLYNIFIHEEIYYNRQRKFVIPVEPTLHDILNFCESYKITFADLISRVLHQDDIRYELIDNQVFLNNEEYNLISDSDLADLDAINQVDWTTPYIIKYLMETRSIDTVYFTRKPAEPYQSQWNRLVAHNYGRQVEFKNIFTPSGQGLRGRPRIRRLIQHWLFNNDEHYNQLDNDWIIGHGINLDNFVD